MADPWYRRPLALKCKSSYDVYRALDRFAEAAQFLTLTKVRGAMRSALLLILMSTPCFGYGAIVVHERSQYTVAGANYLTAENAVNDVISRCGSASCTIRKIFWDSCIAFGQHPVRVFEGLSREEVEAVANASCPNCPIEVICDGSAE
jgi:hypothetical protein